MFRGWFAEWGLRPKITVLSLEFDRSLASLTPNLRKRNLPAPWTLHVSRDTTKHSQHSQLENLVCKAREHRVPYGVPPPPPRPSVARAPVLSSLWGSERLWLRAVGSGLQVHILCIIYHVMVYFDIL